MIIIFQSIVSVVPYCPSCLFSDPSWVHHHLLTMLRTGLSLFFSSILFLIAFQRCGAFYATVQPARSGNGRFPSTLTSRRTSSSFGTKDCVRTSSVVSFMVKRPTSSVDGKPRKYTSVEDGSPLGIAVVVLGFFALQAFGDNFDSSVIKQYAVPGIFCSASVVAGISRLVRNSDSWKKKQDKEG